MDTRLGVVLSTLGAVAVALMTSAITFSGGLVGYEAADTTMLNGAVGNGISNFWASISFLLPVLSGVAVVLFVGYFVMRFVRVR